jgi:hypothetical protein
MKHFSEEASQTSASDRDAIAEHHGKGIMSIGDAFFLTFENAVDGDPLLRRFVSNVCSSSDRYFRGSQAQLGLASRPRHYR